MKKDLKTLIELFWKGRLNKENSENLLSLLDKLSDQETKLYPEEIKVSEDIKRQNFDKIQAKISVKPRFKWLKVASGFAAAILIIVSIYTFNQNVNWEPDEQVSKLLLIENKGSELLEFRLADSSTVYLYPNSSLHYTKDFGELNRNLSLIGKGRFIVTKNADLPFIVTSSNLSVTALGTDFLVNTKDSINQFVSLKEGSILVQAVKDGKIAFPEKVLLQGQQIAIDTKDKIVTSSEPTPNLEDEEYLNPENTTKTERIYSLSYHQTPLESVFFDLSIRFQKKIDYSKVDLNKLSLTGEFSNNMNLSQILNIICKMNTLNFSENGNIIFIKQN